MKNKKEFYYTVVMLIFIAVLVFVLNLMILSSAWDVAPFKTSGQVKAVSIAKSGKPHYITSLQKRELMKLLNACEVLETPSFVPGGSTFKKISLQFFTDALIDIVPKGHLGTKLVFSVIDKGQETLVVEKESGSIEAAINKAFDK